MATSYLLTIFGLSYNTTVVLVGTTVLGIAAGVVGCLALLRRRALLGDALAHSTLPGIWLAFMITGSKSLPLLLSGALISGLIGVAVVAFLARYTKVKEDAAIGIVLSVFFGVGILLSSIGQRTDGSHAGLQSYLLGKTASMVIDEVYMIAWVTAGVLCLVILLYKELKLVCFDRGFAAVQGWPIVLLDLTIMASLTAITVLGLPTVGVVLMVALLIIPGAAARFWCQRLGAMLLLAALFGATTAVVGSLLSSSYDGFPAGPTIVLVGSVLFAFSVCFAPQRGLLSRWQARRKLKRRLDQHKVLTILFESGENEQDFGRGLTQAEIQSHGSKRLDSAANSLLRKGWIQLEAGRRQLTQAGIERAIAVVKSRRLWQQYLLSEANIDRDLVDLDNDVIERVLPASLVEKLAHTLRQAGRYPEAKGVGNSP